MVVLWHASSRGNVTRAHAAFSRQGAVAVMKDLLLALVPGVAFCMPRVLLFQEHANTAEYTSEPRRRGLQRLLVLHGLPVSGML